MYFSSMGSFFLCFYKENCFIIIPPPFLVLWLIRNFLLISFRVCNILSALKRIELVDVMNLGKSWKIVNFPKFSDLVIFIWMNSTCSNTVSWLCMYVCMFSFDFSITCRSHFLFWMIFPEIVTFANDRIFRPYASTFFSFKW